MMQAKITDRERLSRLLQYAELSDSERLVFQGWYDGLTRKTRDELSHRERLWVEVVYEKHDVGRRRAEARRRARAKEQERTTSPLPKKQRGR